MIGSQCETGEDGVGRLLVLVVAEEMAGGLREGGVEFEIGTKKGLARLARVCWMILDIQRPHRTAPSRNATRNTTGQKRGLRCGLSSMPLQYYGRMRR